MLCAIGSLVSCWACPNLSTNRSLARSGGAPLRAGHPRETVAPPLLSGRQSAVIRSLLLASGALARLVTYFALRPDEAPHARVIQRTTGLTPRSLQTELARLERLGVIHREAAGRHVRYVVNEQSPRWRLLRELVRELADPADVIRDALSDVAGVETAFVFGSMARATDVREGSDIDVFVLRGDLAEDRLARRTIVTPAAMLAGRAEEIWATRDRKLEAARARRQAEWRTASPAERPGGAALTAVH